MNNGGGAYMEAVNALVFVISVGAMFVCAPLLAEIARGPLAQIINPRYSAQTAEYLLIGFEWLVWPVVFLTVKAALTLLIVWASFAAAKRYSA